MELMKNILEVYIEVGMWLLSGSWYEVTLKIAGVFGILLLTRGFYFFMDGEYGHGFIHDIAFLLFAVASIAWIFLIIVLMYLFFFS